MSKFKVNNHLFLNKEEIESSIKALNESIEIISLNRTLSYLQSKSILDELQAEKERLETLIKGDVASC